LAGRGERPVMLPMNAVSSGGQAISTGNAEVARGRWRKARAQQLRGRRFWAPPPLPGKSTQILAATGTSLAELSHGSPHSTVCHSPLPARPSHYANTPSARLCGPPAGHCHEIAVKVAPHASGRGVTAFLFRYFSQDTGGNCSQRGINGAECFGASGPGVSRDLVHERQKMQGDHGIPGVRTD